MSSSPDRLVLIPGLAADATMWRHQLAALERWRPRVTDVHMRHASIPAMAAALLDEHPGPLVLCGASMGGMIAMEAARQAPDRMRGLALLGTSAEPENTDMRDLREAAVALFEQGAMEAVIEPNVVYAFHPDHAKDARLVSEYLDFVYRAGAAQLIRQNRALMTRPDARPHLGDLRCPVLVACGAEDALTPPERSRDIASRIPGAQWHVLPRCGHMLTMEQPQAVSELLAAWLSGFGEPNSLRSG